MGHWLFPHLEGMDFWRTMLLLAAVLVVVEAVAGKRSPWLRAALTLALVVIVDRLS